MRLFQRLFFAALIAGLLAGLAMAAMQQWKVAPLIMAAESFEQAAPHVHGEAEPAHYHEDEAWAPAPGVERMVYTVLADLLAAVGFALLLGAVSTLLGLPITATNGVLWGVGGFIAFQLAPALGLAPQLPGMPAADLAARQFWWVATALSTAAGLLIVAKFRNWTAIGLAAIFVLLPQVLGAPAPPADASSGVPAHLATEFAAAALVAGAVFWLLLGPLLGYLNDRFAAAGALHLEGARV